MCALDCAQALRGYYIPHEDIKQSLCHFVAVVWQEFSLSQPQAGNKLVTNLDCGTGSGSVHTLVAFALTLAFVLFIFPFLLLSAEMYTAHRFLLHGSCRIIQGNQQLLNPLKILVEDTSQNQIRIGWYFVFIFICLAPSSSCRFESCSAIQEN